MRLTTDFPIDLSTTIGAFRVGGRDASVRVSATDAWRATRTPEGAATLHLRALDASRQRFAAEAWGPGANWALAHAADLAGAGDTATGFEPTDALVGELWRRQPGLRFGRSHSLVEALLPVVLEQKVTTLEAHRSWHQLQRAFGEPAPGPPELGLYLRPDPERLAALRYPAFHPFGIERRRAEVLRTVCRRAGSIERLCGGSPAAARDALESLPGIGPWTSASVTQLAFGDADAVITGDYHLPGLVGFNLAGERQADDARMLELLEPYRGHRARVVRLLGRGGHPVPRRAPKRRLRDIAAI